MFYIGFILTFFLEIHANYEDVNVKTPAPHSVAVELTCGGRVFDEQFIRGLNPRENQLVPITVNLVLVGELPDSLREMSLVIDSVQILYVINWTSRCALTVYKGHQVLIPERWPSNFPIEKGSSIIFQFAYSWWKHGSKFESGLTEHTIHL